MHSLADEAVAPGNPSASLSSNPASLGGVLRARWRESLALAAFAAIVAAANPFHEPWSDEAQAWQLARSLPLATLFRTYIRYEASPGLWHFVLWILIRLHVSYVGVHWICGAMALASAALLIYRSPFPLYLRLALPFTYFLIFQYAVIARSYVLVPLLLFATAICWKKSPLTIAILLGLLANLSLHAAVISGGLATVYLIESRRGGRVPAWKTKLLASGAILGAFYAFALWTAWPPHDLLLSHFRGQSRPFLLYGIGSLVLGICQPWALSILFWIAIVLCLRARRTLVYMIPVLFFAIFSGVVYAQLWHMGLLVPLFITLLWITWPGSKTPSSRYEYAAIAALGVFTATQILWAGYAIRWDHYHDFSGDLAASRFLAPFVRDHARIDVTWVDEPDAHAFDAVGILPYFGGGSIYENQSEPFWWWSENNPSERRFNELLPTRPQIIVVEARLRHPDDTFDLNQPGFQRLTRAGYRLTNEFCGVIPQRLELGITSCHLIFQPDGSPQSSAK